MIINKFYLHFFANTTIFVCMLLQSSCMVNNDPSKMKMSLFEPVCWIDTFKHDNKVNTFKIVSYLVDHYQNTAAYEHRIDSFVCTIPDSTWLVYDECNIQIYKKSKHTNNEHIKKEPRALYRYSQENDFLYQYRWMKGSYYSKISMKGKLFYQNIICEPVRKSE